jgi:hypothetical protein
MIRYYLGVIRTAISRKPWPHPVVRSKYNALQRGAYFTMPLVGALVVLSGWAMHKPSQLGWLERLFVSYDGARIVHFAACSCSARSSCRTSSRRRGRVRHLPLDAHRLVDALSRTIARAHDREA